MAAFDGVHRFGAERGQLGFHAFTTPHGGVSDVECCALELALGGLLDVAQLGHVGEVQDGLADFQAHRRVDLVDVQQVRLGADEGHQRHHDRFADRVDRRVGHLRKQLLEVVVQRLVFVGQHGQRAVVAHGANGFFTGRGHGGQQELDVFLCGAKGLLQIEQRHVGCGCLHRGVCHVVEFDAQVFDPLLVGFGAGQTGLQLFVVDHAALFQIDQEHLAGLQTPFAHDLALRNRQHAGLGAHDDHVVVGDDVARRAQAVAVERGADLAAVSEHDGGGAVPWLEHGSMVFIEGLAALVHGGVLFPRLGDHHHHGLADGVTRHRQQFQAVVECGGVGLTCEADGVELLQVGRQHGRRHHAFAGLHPVVVAFDGVDLAVVRHIAVGVSQWPLGESVGRETLVHQAQSRDAALVLQVQIISTDLIGQQQALVDRGAAGHAGDVVLVAVLQTQVLDGCAGGLADDIQLALQGVLHDHIGATTDEDLAHDRLFFAHGGRHGHVTVHRHIAPTQHHLAFGLDGAFEFLLTSHARSMLFGQEDHAHTVFAKGWQRHALLGHLVAVQRIGQLNQDTGTVAHERVRAHSTPVVQVFQDLERLRHDRMGLVPFDVGHKADTTSIVLVGGVIQTGRLEMFFCTGRSHGRS